MYIKKKINLNTSFRTLTVPYPTLVHTLPYPTLVHTLPYPTPYTPYKPTAPPPPLSRHTLTRRLTLRSVTRCMIRVRSSGRMAGIHP